MAIKPDHMGYNLCKSYHLTHHSSPLEKSICLSPINTHLIQSKIEEFQQHVIQEKTDVCIIIESSLKSSDKSDNLDHKVPP